MERGKYGYFPKIVSMKYVLFILIKSPALWHSKLNHHLGVPTYGMATSSSLAALLPILLPTNASEKAVEDE